MGLTFDIKANDSIAQSALEAAKAFDYLAKKEEAVNALSEKIGDSYARAAKEAAKIGAAYAAPAQTKNVGGEKKTDKKVSGSYAKELAAEKKETAEENKKKKSREDQVKLAKAFGTAIVGASVAAVGLGVALALAAKNAFDGKKEASALVNAFSGGRGNTMMKQLDTLAVKLGASFSDVREEYVKFREAGANTPLAGKLIKMRADLVAVTGSAEAADKQIGYITAGLDGMTNQQALIRMKQVSAAFGGIGSGAKAAAFNAESFAGAQNKISNAVGEKLSEVWEKIGPSIGKAVNNVADLFVEMLKSKEAQETIDALAKAFKDVSAAINKDTMISALNAIKATAETVAMVIKGAAAIFGGGISKGNAQLHKSIDALDENEKALQEKRAEILGRSISDGLAMGIADGSVNASNAATEMADKTAVDFAKALGIHSPSKVFAGFGKNTVVGFQEGQAKALSTGAMPLQEAASEPVTEQPAQSMRRQSVDVGSVSGGGITIQSLVVQSDGDPADIARAIRYELQRVLMAGNLSRGVA